MPWIRYIDCFDIISAVKPVLIVNINVIFKNRPPDILCGILVRVLFCRKLFDNFWHVVHLNAFAPVKIFSQI